MEESLGTGSKEPVATTSTRGTTSKLPPENTADNTNQPTAANDGQSSTPYRVDSLQLVVIEGFQVGRGVARIDPSDMAKLGCQPGDIIMITGARTTAAKVVPSAIVDRGQQTIQMDSQVRKNSASGLGKRITIHKARVRTAEKVTLLPLSGGAPIQESDLQYIARYLIGLPVTIGDLYGLGRQGRLHENFSLLALLLLRPAIRSKSAIAAISMLSFLPCSHSL